MFCKLLIQNILIVYRTPLHSLFHFGGSLISNRSRAKSEKESLWTENVNRFFQEGDYSRDMMSTKFQNSLTFFLVAKEKDCHSRVYSGWGWRSRLSRPTFPSRFATATSVAFNKKNNPKQAKNKQTNKLSSLVPGRSSLPTCEREVSEKVIGSFSNDDGDGNQDVKKAKGLDWQNNNFARASCFFVHFFTVLARQRRENA